MTQNEQILLLTGGEEVLQESVPQRVLMAYRFVGLCNQRMVPCMYFSAPLEDDDSSGELVDAGLHPHQEAAFREACKVLGDYFRRPVVGVQGSSK